eukprot:gene12907-17297_t
MRRHRQTNAQALSNPINSPNYCNLMSYYRNQRFSTLLLFLGMACVFVTSLRTGRLLKHSSIYSLGSKYSDKSKVFSTATTSVADVSNVISINHPAYEKLDHFFIKEYGLQATLFQHKKSGAQVMSVVAPDDNKVFGITFRTPPDDSTGVPHVLEHSVLCGSKKYPVKEPFVDLLKGSLQNFLNAFTYPDRTCYPVASTNTKDFYNLINVYLDAVLNPRAISDPQVLQQEGWHYELEDPKSPLTIKGVVYNEMKGVYSSPDSLLGRATQQALFPSNAYGVDSGGDPLKIPDLTFNQFKSFHQSYYHPSNSRVFFYGDDDQFTRLELLDGYLKEFNKIPVTSEIKFQQKFDKPRRLVETFPISPGSEPKHILTVNWLLNDRHLTTKEILSLGILDSLLLGTSTSTLRKVLTESQLGESVTGGGLSDELIQSTFSVGMKGVKKEDVTKLEQLVLSTIEKAVTDGFEQDAIQAAINTYEFRLREFNTGSFPRGLSLMLGMMSHWIYDKTPVDGVLFEEPLQQLKDDLAAGKPVFQNLLKEYFVNNNHRVTVEMIPDLEMESKRVADEESKLSEIKNKLSETEIENIIEMTKKLKEAQQAVDSPEARATLPTLSLDDIDPIARELPIEISNKFGNDAVLLTHPLQTSGILYAEVLFDYSGIDLEDMELLPLFSRMLIETGTTSYDETQLSRKIGSTTGGISVSYHNDIKSSLGTVANTDDVLLYLMIRGKAVTENVPILFDLFNEILQHSNLNNQKRAIEMLKESKVRKESSVLSAGHSYGAARLSGRSSFLGYLGEVTGGLTSVREAASLLEKAEQDWPSIQSRLMRMREAMVKKGGIVVNLTGDKSILDTSMPTIDTFIQGIPKASNDFKPKKMLSQWDNSKLLPLQNEAFIIPSQVNYVVKGGTILKPGERVPGSYSVVSRFLST